MLEALIANKTPPAYRAEVAGERHGGLDVVIVHVPKARTLVATTSGRYVRWAVRALGDRRGRKAAVPADAAPRGPGANNPARWTGLVGVSADRSSRLMISVPPSSTGPAPRRGRGDEHLAELSACWSSSRSTRWDRRSLTAGGIRRAGRL